ncbi:MAG: hypothetical protein MHPSP_000716, partial [Paramarteilia canceri]
PNSNDDCAKKSNSIIKLQSIAFLRSNEKCFGDFIQALENNPYKSDIIRSKSAIFTDGYLKLLGIVYDDYKYIFEIDIDKETYQNYLQLLNKNFDEIDSSDLATKECSQSYPTINGIVIMIYKYLNETSISSSDKAAQMKDICNKIPMKYIKCYKINVCNDYFNSNYENYVVKDNNVEDGYENESSSDENSTHQNQNEDKEHGLESKLNIITDKLDQNEHNHESREKPAITSYSNSTKKNNINA